MVDYSTSELIEMLNTQDECTWIEAKKDHPLIILLWKRFVRFQMNQA